MKTNKLWSIMMMLVLLLGTAVAFSSCSKDNDDGESNKGSSLIGTWEANDRFLEIGASSWHTYLKNEYGGPQHRRGTYTYDASSRTIFVSIQAIQGNNSAYTQKFFVQTLTSSSLSLMDMEYGDVYVYKRK